MRVIPTEVTITLGEDDSILAAQRCVMRIDDEGAGPFLVIEGKDDEPDAVGGPHCFYLCSADEIDQFANACKALLAGAERVRK